VKRDRETEIKAAISAGFAKPMIDTAALVAQIRAALFTPNVDVIALAAVALEIQQMKLERMTRERDHFRHLVSLYHTGEVP
jgi:hypothetical protein